MTTYLYRAADGVWRNRCRAHIVTTGPYRAVTTPTPTPEVRICVICQPWGATPITRRTSATEEP